MISFDTITLHTSRVTVYVAEILVDGSVGNCPKLSVQNSGDATLMILHVQKSVLKGLLRNSISFAF